MPYTRIPHRFTGTTTVPDARRQPPTSRTAADDASRGNAVSPDQLVDEVQAARLLRVSRRTLQGWRFRGDGPLFVRLSRRCIRYRCGDLQEFLVQRMRRSTSDPGGDGR